VETDPLDAALTVFAATAPEFSTLGFSNHGPMVAEVLHHVGRGDAIEDFVERYKQRLSPNPHPVSRPLSEVDWPDALGQPHRFPEWLSLFEIEMADRPVAAVVGEWVPRLVPGMVAAAMHGLIRTAHGLRALRAADTPTRRLELAHGLAYWAATYTELPGPPLLIGHQDVPAALADLPYLPEDTPEAFLITDKVIHVMDISEEFEQAVASLGHSGDALSLLDALAIGGAHAYLRSTDTMQAIALLHSITGPMAVEMVLPWLAEEDKDAALGYAWQAVAAIHVAYDTDRSMATAEPAMLPSPEEIFELALASGDEHAMKLAEAAGRAYGRTNDPVLLQAALGASTRFS
jgi:hypothetical protein